MKTTLRTDRSMLNQIQCYQSYLPKSASASATSTSIKIKSDNMMLHHMIHIMSSYNLSHVLLNRITSLHFTSSVQYYPSSALSSTPSLSNWHLLLFLCKICFNVRSDLTMPDNCLRVFYSVIQGSFVLDCVTDSIFFAVFSMNCWNTNIYPG